MDLVLKVNLTFVDIESDESEGAAMLLAVGADIDPLHETHFRAPEEAGGGARFLVCSRRGRNVH